MRAPVLTTTSEARGLPAWQEQMVAVGTTSDLVPVLLQRRQELLPRFAAYYTQLRALPRCTRRVLQRKWKHSLAGLALLLALGQEPVLAATITVNGGCSLINAITAANTDTATGGCPAGSGVDTLVLANSSVHILTAVNNTTYGSTGLPVVSSRITIEGHNSTIRREGGAPEFRIFTVNSSGELTLKETTVSGGVVAAGSFPNSSGGGVLNYGTLTLTDSTLSGNFAFQGGGVLNGGSLTITNSTLSGNSASTGGGVLNGGSLTITNSTLSGNLAYSSGGGVSNYSIYAPVTITDSTLSGNSANGGGGVFNRGPLTITNSTLSGNSASIDGGGVLNYGPLTITNSTLSGNSAFEDGGGVYNREDSTLTLTDSTLSGNSAGFRGGGVVNFSSGTLTLIRTLVSGNTAPNSPEISNQPSYCDPFYCSPLGVVYADNFNLFGHDGDAGVEGFTPGATDVIPTVPLSDILDTTLADNGGPTFTHALVSGSPAVDAVATGCPPPTTDQRGFLRPADGDSIPGARCDIGAFEFNALPLVVLNDLVTFVPLPSTFSTTTDPAGCPPGFVGTFSFTARLTDKATSPPLSDLRVEVDTLTNGNLLQNADDGPGGVGATLTVAEQGQFADGVLSTGEEVDVPFVICLQQRGPFTFFVDVLGVEE